jgi:PncC family amidohydrolase
MTPNKAPQPLGTDIGELLLAQSFTVVVAESCTGGLLGDTLTNVPGSSAYFLGGILAYSNAVKQNILLVPADTLEVHGAVSEPVALAMANNVRKMFHADIGMSITGIAGPGGGTATKPVGLTWVGISTPEGSWAQQFVWDTDRVSNKRASARAALDILREYLTRGIPKK